MADTLALLGGTPLRKRPFTRWPIFDQSERAQLEDVLTSANWGGFPSPNRKATEFAATFAAMHGARFAIPATSGTSALEVALKALDVGPGDEVIVPAITFCATAYAAVACMARPVFADVCRGSVCVDPAAAERLITPRTRAIVPVHYGCTLADLDALGELSRRRSIPIVEDCAHVPGATWSGSGAGSFGALGCFSFQSTKPMTAGEGGIIITSDPRLEQKCQSLINCGRRRVKDSFTEALLGANYRMTEWQCAVLLAQLKRLPGQIQHKNAMAERLRAGMRAMRGVTPIEPDPRVTRPVIYAFTLRLDEDALGVSRNRFVRALRAEGIPAGVGNEPVYRSPLLPRESKPFRKVRELSGASEADAMAQCPVAEHLFEHELCALPHEVLLGDERDIDDILAAFDKVAANAAALSSARLEHAA